jgi:hypothetical protein
MKPNKNTAIKLLQLPIPAVHSLYLESNIPLAAGYLKSYAVHKGAAADDRITIIPRELANHGGCGAIMDWILKSDTDIVGLTSYMWNIDRNLYLARKIKEQAPEIIVVLGGLEIDSTHWSLDSEYVDAFVIGEGEQAFVDLIIDHKSGNPLKRIYQQKKMMDLKEVPNPYLDHVLIPHENESMFIETMRGCPYLCKYCFYSRSYSEMRYFPVENLDKMFAVAREHDVPEIYMMDPSFNVTPGLEEKLGHIAKINTTGIPIHTEIRLESITPEIARLMKNAGFRSVEAGLQSVNEKSLAAIGRNWNRGRFIRGAELLQAQDIDIKTGVILGLPYDTIHDFELTLDFVVSLNLEESMEIYPLSLIPGTRLREDARMFGINYMQHPPYQVLSTTYMKEKDIKNAVEKMEHKLDMEFFPPVIPRFANLHPPYIHFLDLREKADSQLSELYRSAERMGNYLTILADIKTEKKKLIEFGKWLRDVSPCTLVQLVIDSETIPGNNDIRELTAVFHNPRHYFNHIHHYKIDTQGKYSFRVFHLTGNLETTESYLYRPVDCDLVLRYTPRLLERGREILEEKPILLVESPIPDEEVKELKQIYEGFENFLILYVNRFHSEKWR